MKIIRPSKDAIREMPVFKGLSPDSIIMVANDADLLMASNILVGVANVGFDSESKPTFKKGEKSAGPHVIQLATTGHALLFTPHFSPGIDLALNVLVNDSVTKYGFGLSGDKNLFKKRFNIEVKNTVDLAVVAKRVLGLKENVGARAAIAILFKQRLTKSAQKSNWANYPLAPHQLKYAADDAYAGLCVAEALKKLEVI